MYNPDFVPTGPNNRSNEYYKKINHVKLARVDSNRTEFFGTIGGVPGTPPEPPATLYANHLFLNGAPSGPVLGNSPPDNHSIGFNTVNSAPVQLGDTWFGWEINPEVASGRSYLTYSLAANNPNLQIGDIVRISWVVSKYAGSGNVVLSFSNQIGVNIIEENTRAANGEDIVVSYLVEITEAGYDFSTRIGTGVSSNQSAHMLISEPKLVDAKEVPTITGRPTIAGTIQVGETATATYASSDGVPTPVDSGQWLRGVTLVGTGTTYTFVTADEGETFTFTQTATNSEGTDTATSAPTVPVAGVSLADYIINGFTPPYVSDFAKDVYFKDGVATTFDELHTYDGDGLRTMTDSDGFEKYNPHNFQIQSDDISETAIAWSYISGASNIDANTWQTVATDGYLLTRSTASVPVVSSATYTIEFRLWANRPEDTGKEFTIGAALIGQVNTLSSKYTVPTDPTTFSLEVDITTATELQLQILAESAGTVQYKTDNLRIYRSDLGGMVNNPDTGDSYVPTTTAARYLPRRGHHIWNGTAWVRKGLRLEDAAATNLLLHSGDFTDPVWTSTASTASADGSAFSLVPTTANSAHTIHQNPSWLLNTDYTISIDAAAAGYNFIAINIFDGASSAWTWFNLTNGTVSTIGSGASTTMELLDDGFYRCIYSRPTSGSGSSNFRIYCAETADVLNFAGDGVSGIRVRWPQLEEGSIPTSYIPTNDTTETRPIESLTDAAENMPAYTNAVSIQLDGVMTYADEDVVFQYTFFDWNTGIESIRCFLSTDGETGEVYSFQRAGGVNDSSVSAGNAYAAGANVPYNLASRHGSTFINASVDGTINTVNLTPTALPDLSTAPFQIMPTFNGTISQVVVWPEDIGDIGIAEASS